MPSIQERDGRYQLRVKHKLLPKPYFSTFDSYDEAEKYGDGLVRMLKRGIIPTELQDEVPEADDPLVLAVARAYTLNAPITDSDNLLLTKVMKEMPGLRVSGITAGWVDDYVRTLKVVDNIAPGTIRKKIGVLARVIDWHLRRTTPPGTNPPTNPLRVLPRGYSAYSREDAAKLKKDQKVKRDTIRDRRLSADEVARIITVLRGGKIERLKREHGKLTARPELEMMFRLIIDTGLRLSEAYSLRTDHLELDRGFTRVDGSKGHRGMIKPRIVPLKPELIEALRAYTKDKIGLLFPFWDGRPENKKLATREAVQLFIRTFAHAKVEDVTEHDLRHEACCRWFELKRANGWIYSDVEICRIMGWSNYNMVLRYASLRGEDLAARLANVDKGGARAATA